jgi:two-component system, OmpR family, alkaline phosphatase synthesis response regulator PhoP
MSEKKFKILLIDDEADILDFLSFNLKKENYEVETAINGVEGIQKAISFLPDLIVIDVMMPQMDGIETCTKLRAMPATQKTLIMFLSAREEDFTHVAAYDAGADDYITKPIRPRVFLSKINALSRRNMPENATIAAQEDGNFIIYGDLKIDKERVMVFRNDLVIPLVKKEFELLSLLVSRPGKVFGRAEILRKIWGNDVIVGDRTIDVHIRKLREKIGEDSIATVKGMGYKVA